MGYLLNNQTGARYDFADDASGQRNTLSDLLTKFGASAANPIDYMGQKGYLTPGGDVVGIDANGTPWRAVLGYDSAASQKATKQDIDMQNARAELEKTKAAIRNIDFDNQMKLAEAIDKMGGDATPYLASLVGGGTAMSGQNPSIYPSVGGRQARDRQQAAYKAGLEEVKKDEVQVIQAQAVEQALKRWGELNPNVVTGPIAGRRPISFNPDFQEMGQLQNYLSMNNFKPGQGQMSNMERALIRGAGPNVTNDEETNKRIVQIMLGGAQNTKDRQNFRQWYLQTKGDLMGADQMWQDYLEANPRYVPAGNGGGISENAKRIPWMQWIQGKAQSTQAPAGIKFLGFEGQ